MQFTAPTMTEKNQAESSTTSSPVFTPPPSVTTSEPISTVPQSTHLEPGRRNRLVSLLIDVFCIPLALLCNGTPSFSSPPPSSSPPSSSTSSPPWTLKDLDQAHDGVYAKDRDIMKWILDTDKACRGKDKAAVLVLDACDRDSKSEGSREPDEMAVNGGDGEDVETASSGSDDTVSGLMSWYRFNFVFLSCMLVVCLVLEKVFVG